MLRLFKVREIKVSIRSTLIGICIVPVVMVLGTISYFATEIRNLQRTTPRCGRVPSMITHAEENA